MLMVYLYGRKKGICQRKKRVGFKKLFSILRMPFSLTLCNCGRRYCGGDFSRLREAAPSLLLYAVFARFFNRETLSLPNFRPILLTSCQDHGLYYVL